jgi:hypothetical protein
MSYFEIDQFFNIDFGIDFLGLIFEKYFENAPVKEF